MITELRPAGAERIVYELATRLGPLGFEVDVLACRGGAVADDLRAAGVTVHTLDVRGKLDVTKWFKLRRILRRGRYDILHTHLFHADLAGRLAIGRRAIPHLVHSVHVAEKRFRPWRFTWARWAAKRCDRIVCVSAGVRDDHARRAKLDADRYTVIHNGVDLERYKFDAASRSEVRRRWGVGDDDVLCAYVGRLDAQKGIDVLTDGFERAASACGRLRLVIAGEGPQRKDVEQWLARSKVADRVRVLGFTDDVPGVLVAADIFCQPSEWEGFCLAAAEAMAAGLPVVATDVDGLNEVVEPAVTGVLVEPGSARQFAAAVIKFADDPALRATMGAAGRARAARHFSIDHCVALHARLYRELCGGSVQGR